MWAVRRNLSAPFSVLLVNSTSHKKLNSFPFVNSFEIAMKSVQLKCEYTFIKEVETLLGP